MIQVMVKNLSYEFEKSVNHALENVKYEHLIAGVAGGVTSTLCLQPLDVVKIRFAVNDGRSGVPNYTGIGNALKTIYHSEGVRGLYRGAVPNVCGAGASWGLYFLFYNAIKLHNQQDNIHTVLKPVDHLVAAAQAGGLTLLITNPLWVVKTRLCLQYERHGNQYNGMFDALKKIYQREGIRGYYRGLIPGILGVSHGAIQFMIYEELKDYINRYKQNDSTRLTTSEYLMCAAISKLIAVAITYPYQVVRARLQSQHYNYKGTLYCTRETWKREGIRGFYKGLGTNLIRVVPATMITFITYEKVVSLLMDQTN